MAKRATPEGLDAFIEAGADPADLGLGDPGVDTHRSDQVVDRARRDPGDVGLHHHCVEGLVDAPTRLEQSGEERALAELRDRQRQVAGLRREHLRAGPVAVRDAIGAPFPRVGTDLLGRFGVDGLLERPLGQFADEVAALPDAERVEQVGNGRLRQSHRRVLLVVHLVVHIPGSRRWLTSRWTRFPPRQDWYDIAFVLLHNDLDGPIEAADAVTARFQDDLAAMRTGLDDLKALFADPSAQGSAAYAEQMLVDHPDLDLATLRADAVVAVDSFHERLYGS